MKNYFSIIIPTILSIDFVAMQTDFLNSLHLLSDSYRSIFNGWFGGILLISICIYPVVYYFLCWLNLIPLKFATVLGIVPYLAFGVWLLNIVYLAALTEFDAVSVHLRPDLSTDDTMAVWNKARSEGIPMTVVSDGKGTTAWINAKYAAQGRELCKNYIADK